MHPAYRLADVDTVPSPALVVHPALIRANIAAVVRAAGGPHRLRPHVKTHKTAEIVRMQLEAGVTRHKCATIAEAEMLAAAGAPDVLVAYPLVGPNVGRLAALKKKYPGTHFASLVDHPNHARQLSDGMTAAGLTAEFVLDVDVGMHRTGVALEHAEELYALAAGLPGLVPGGLQVYDGQNTMEPRPDREAAVRRHLGPVLELRAALEKRGFPVGKIVGGGTPTFPVYAAIRDVPGLECSPGTYVLHDHGYGSKYPDLEGVTPAAVFVTRVISRPTPTRVTLDLGNKAVAADPPLERRVRLLDFPEYTPVTHSEEHYAVETAGADRYAPGDVVYALPGHVCPSVALHRELLVAEDNRVVGRWAVAARDRVLTV
jgi:D-serine deaminase-like pyridoxal phosphate-dependent protein